jgi:hypothetical protein
MRVALIVGLLFALLTAGCANVTPPPPVAPSPATSPQTAAVTVAPVAPPAAPPSSPAPTATQGGAATGDPAGAPATPSTSASIGQRDTKAAPPAAKAPPPAGAAQATKKDSTPPEVVKQRPPPLDLASLRSTICWINSGPFTRGSSRPPWPSSGDRMICWSSRCSLFCRTLTQHWHPRSRRRAKQSGAFFRTRRSSQRSNSRQEILWESV